MANPIPRDPPVTSAVLPFKDMVVRIPRVTSAAIIGAGELGGAVARALAMREAVDRIVIVDAAGSASAGVALDIQQSLAISGSHGRLIGTTDVARAVGCDVCVIADRFGITSQAHEDEDARTAAVLALTTPAPAIFAGTWPSSLLMAIAGLPASDRGRVLGSSPEAFASAVRSIVALEAHCAPGEVALTVVGAPPDGFVVPWSGASIGGSAAEQVFSPVQIARLEVRIAALWPPGSYALGTAAACVAEGVLGSARRSFNVLALLDGEFGIRNRVGALPALLSPRGIAARRPPALSAREQMRLESALERQAVGR